jgi:hypothetical protein
MGGENEVKQAMATLWESAVSQTQMWAHVNRQQGLCVVSPVDYAGLQQATYLAAIARHLYHHPRDPPGK